MIYVLQVYTGKELEVYDDLTAAGLVPLLPREARLLRRKGAWQTIPRVLMPGYIFWDCDDLTPEAYYTVRQTDHVIRMLGGGTPQALPEHEAEYIRLMHNGGQPLQPCRITTDGLIAGPLVETGVKVIEVNRRQRRATALIDIMGRPVPMTFSVVED